MGIVESIVKRMLQEAIIIHKSQPSKSVYHLRIQSEKLKDAAFIPGYFLRLAVGLGNPDASLKDILRSYTVWDMDKSKGTIDLAIATHSAGIGAQWAAQCSVGDPVFFGWHKGKFLVDDTADSYLMIGDLSALAHLYEINRNLSPGKNVQGIFYSPVVDDLFPDLDGSTPFSFHAMSGNPQGIMLEKIKEKLSNMTGKKLVYIAGDSRLCVALSQYFRKELKWGTKQIKVKPFWNPKKKGLE